MKISEYSLGKRQLKEFYYRPLLKRCALILCTTAFGVLWLKVNGSSFAYVVGFSSLWFGIIHVLPLIILARRHIKVSKRKLFCADIKNRTFYYKDKNNSVYFGRDQIQRVILVMSPPKFYNRPDILSGGYFYYWKIILNDETVVVLSCLILDEETFFGNEFLREKEMFPWPELSYLS